MWNFRKTRRDVTLLFESTCYLYILFVVEFVQHSLRDFSRKSFISLSSIQKTVISGGRSSSFLERLTHSAHGNDTFYRLSAVVSVIPHAQILNLKIILFQELEKNEFEPLYQAANPGFILPADSSELALGESFDCGSFDTSPTAVDVTCDTFISLSASAKIIYFFVSLTEFFLANQFFIDGRLRSRGIIQGKNHS
jgi:hypothetical protein